MFRRKRFWSTTFAADPSDTWTVSFRFGSVGNVDKPAWALAGRRIVEGNYGGIYFARLFAPL